MPNPDATLSSPQPAEDLERAELQAHVRKFEAHLNNLELELHDQGWQLHDALQERDAALARERELRELVNAVSDRKTSQESEDYAGHSPGCRAIRGADDGDGRFDVWLGDPADCTCGWTKVLAALESIEALLAPPAAKEEVGERG